MKPTNLVHICQLTDKNPDEYNSDEYNKLYSSVPRNICIYSLVTYN
jgi:hypothetical protein